MKISLSTELKAQKSGKAKSAANDVSSVTLFVFATSTKDDKKSEAKLNLKEAQNELQSALADKSITGKAQEVVLFRDKNLQVDGENFRHLAVVGLSEKIDAEVLRQSAAGVVSSLAALKSSSAVVHFGQSLGSKNQTSENLQAFAEGLLLSSYDFNELKAPSKTKVEAKNVVLTFKDADSGESKKALHRAEVLSECVNFSRRLGDMPGNLMTPSILAKTVQEAAKGTAAKCTVWDKKRIEKERMGGLLGVAQGSAQDPRFIILEYKGGGAKDKPLVYVGKGLTFDTGGISIKPSAAMEEMKYDMCGGANVLGAVLAIAKLKLKVNAIALVPATENMPGSKATKPGDVHKARNGKTFEVNNTDAEGRLILSDALCYASELKPKFIVDAATLTGAIVVALGNTHTGFFTRNDDMKKKIEKAAGETGEWVWQMPLCDHHVKDMKGTFADLSNISSSKGAGSATAAAFLEQFVESGIPWAHFDIAGTGWAVGNRLPYCPKKGASGCMVRTFVQLAENEE